MIKGTRYGVLIGVMAFSLVFAQTERWVYGYNGPGNGRDEAESIFYGDGNVYASGRASGSGTESDFAVISLTSQGEERWVYTHNGNANLWDESLSVVYGNDHNVYSAGYTMTGIFRCAFTVISLNENGEERWIYRYYGNSPIVPNAAFSVKYGVDGNIYVAGTSTGSSNSRLAFTVISLTPGGNERWIYTHSNSDIYNGAAYSLIYANDANIYACGYSCPSFSSTNYKFTVSSITSTGDERWVYKYDESGNKKGRAYCITQGIDGNIYVGGATSGTGTGNDFTIISLTPTGEERWVYRYNGPGNAYDDALSLVCGNDGNIYAAGLTTSDSNSRDFTVISLTDEGNLRWIYRYDGPGHGNDEAKSIVYGNDDYLYVSGYTEGINSDADFTVISLTTWGEERWVYVYNGQTGGFDVAKSIIYAEDGNLYMAGTTWGNGTGPDFTLISLKPETPGIRENYHNNKEYTLLFPVFLEDNMRIKFDSPYEGKVNIIIFNTAGRVVFHKTLPLFGSTLVLNTDNLRKLPQGTYFLCLFGKHKMIEKCKVIKK